MLATWTTDSFCSYHGTSLNFRLGLSHDNNVLFEPSEFSLVRGVVTGLIGTNGSGKTSLAKTIASKELPEFPNDLTVQYLSSHETYVFTQDEEESMTAETYLNNAVETNISSLRQEIEQLEDSLNENTDSIEEQYNLLGEKYELLDEMRLSSVEEINQTLDDLGFRPHLSKPIGQLSSGWRYKCRLATAFMAHPDVLIIDEPSFLDAASTKWLIQKISYAAHVNNSMVLLISHKESLLDSLCDRIWYINSANLTLSCFSGSYQTFRASHMNDVHRAEKSCVAYEQQVQGATKTLKHVQSQLQKREQSFKKTTAKNADQRFIKGKNKESKQKADRSAAAKLKQLKRQAETVEEWRKQALCEQVKPLCISGVVADGPAIQLIDVSFTYDSDHVNGDPSKAESSAKKFLFGPLNECVGPQDRILLCGPNGCGKSTLLRLILGELQPSEGNIVRRGQALYFPQSALSDLSTYHSEICAAAYLIGDASMTNTAARQHLGNFGLKGDVALRPIQCLSAGQRVRLHLAKQLLHNPQPTLLVMDEISENLDVETQQSLSEVLSGFEGAVILVSHDVNFCGRFKATQMWHLSESGLKKEFVS